MTDLQRLAMRALQPLPDDGLEMLVAGEPYRRFLYLLIAEMRPEVALEIGVDGSNTSALMCAGCAETLVVGVDHKPVPHNAPARAWPNFRAVWCDSLGALPVVRALLDNRRVGVVFQDSSHHAEPSRLEWEYYRPLLAETFAWVCDDVTESFRMGDEPLGMLGYFHNLPGRKHLFPDLHVGNVIGVVTPL